MSGRPTADIVADLLLFGGAKVPWPRQEAADRLVELDATLRQAREAIRLTREYVDPACYGTEISLLPPLPGWSWFEAVVAIDAVLGDGPSAWLP